MKKFKIKNYLPIDGASKSITFDGEPYDMDNDEHFSEWAYAVAQRDFTIGQEISEKEFMRALQAAKCLQVLNDLCDKGYIEMSWDGDEPVYSITEAGKEYAKNKPK